MRKTGTLVVAVLVLALLTTFEASAQVGLESTRFTIGAAPVLYEPTGEFRRNVSNGFGGGGGLSYHLDRPGLFALRFDVSAAEYGRETKRVPISELIGQRVLVDETTTNSITALSGLAKAGASSAGGLKRSGAPQTGAPWELCGQRQTQKSSSPL